LPALRTRTAVPAGLLNLYVPTTLDPLDPHPAINMSVVRTMIRITAAFFMMTPSSIALVPPGNYTDMNKLGLANLVDDIRRDRIALGVT
jgi:hypothetical protein